MENKKTQETSGLHSYFCLLIQGENILIEGDFSEFLKRYDKNNLVTYAKYAKEEGGDTSNVHYHLFMRVKTQQRNSYFFNPLHAGGVPFHLDERVINIKHAMDYIGNIDFTYSDKHPDENKRGKKKGGKCHWIREFGDIKTVRIPKPGKSGNDTDSRLERLKALLVEGATLTELYDHDFPIMIKYGKQLRDYVIAKDTESETLTHIELVGKRLQEQERKHNIEIEQIHADFDARMRDVISKAF